MKTVPIDRLGFLVHDVARLMRKRFEKRGSRHGLPAAQWRLLVRVVKEEGISQARIAELLEVEPISVSRLIDRMEEGGWIERRQDPSDRRVRTIHSTEKSREAYEEIKSHAGEVYEEALAGVPEEARAMLMSALDAMVGNLSDAETVGGQSGSEGRAA